MNGIKVVKDGPPTRRDKFSPGLDELAGLGAEAERDGAIIALALRCQWSSERLAAVFRITPRRVQQIVATFRAEFEESR